MFVPNPYRPGADETPTYLAGRDKTLEEGEKILTTISYGYPARSEIFYYPPIWRISQEDIGMIRQRKTCGFF